ncbi:MAG: peptidyl-tRNA hydrolase, partial [Spirochaetales bacterium]
GLGGHNGLRSMKERLGTADFMRLRFGIGRPAHADIAGYVLSDFNRDEREKLECSIFPRAETGLLLCMDEGFDTAFSKYQKFNALD